MTTHAAPFSPPKANRPLYVLMHKFFAPTHRSTSPSAATRLRQLSLGVVFGFALSAPLCAQTKLPTPLEAEEDAPVVAVHDPIEGFNRLTFRFNDGVFTYAFRPINRGYEFVVPRPLRQGLSNAFDNVNFPVRFVSSLLQGKVTRATKETGKFVVNTVGGIGGLFRTAEKIPTLANLPEEDMGQVLGTWGMPAGPYVVLPILGPSSPREFLGFAGDYVLTPTNWDSLGVGNREWIAKDYKIAVSAAGFVSELPSAVAAYDAVTRDAIDPYIAVRDGYFSHRAAELRK